MVRVNMDFDDIVIGDNDNTVTDGFQITFKLLLFLHIVRFFHVYDELSAVAVFNIRCRKIITSCSHLRLCGSFISGDRSDRIKRDPFS